MPCLASCLARAISLGLLYFLQIGAQPIEWNVSPSLSFQVFTIPSRNDKGHKNQLLTTPLNLTARTLPLSSKNPLIELFRLRSDFLYKLLNVKKFVSISHSAGKNIYSSSGLESLPTRQP